MAAVDTDAPTPTPEQELEQLRAGGLTDEQLQAKMLDELLDIVEYMRPVDDKNKRRIRLYLLLNAMGVSNKAIAEYVGVTAESVRQALLKARRGRDGT